MLVEQAAYRCHQACKLGCSVDAIPALKPSPQAVGLQLPVQWHRKRASRPPLEGHPCLPQTRRCPGCLEATANPNCLLRDSGTYIAQMHSNDTQPTKLFLQLLHTDCCCRCCPHRLNTWHPHGLGPSNPANLQWDIHFMIVITLLAIPQLQCTVFRELDHVLTPVV